MKVIKLYYALGLILGFVIIATITWSGTGTKMVVCDVGQGDAIIIVKKSIQVLIDGGPNTEKILSCLEKHIPFYDRRIELIVLTNTDFDHMNGLSAVVQRYSVMQFVTADGVHQSDAIDKFRHILIDQQVQVDVIERGDRLVVGSKDTSTQLVFDVLWPPDTIEEYVAVFSDQLNDSKREQILGASAKRGNLNERSVMLELLEADKRILLSGDAGDQTEKQLLKMGQLNQIDYLKVPHHGSRYASTLEYLKVIKPKVAIISVGEKNRYGHPTSETIERLEQVGATILRTDIEGDIVINLEPTIKN